MFLIDSVPGLRYNDEIYTIDGDTGLQVARQLRKGDRIHVGINGRQSRINTAKNMENEYVTFVCKLLLIIVHIYVSKCMVVSELILVLTLGGMNIHLSE